MKKVNISNLVEIKRIVGKLRKNSICMTYDSKYKRYIVGTEGFDDVIGLKIFDDKINLLKNINTELLTIECIGITDNYVAFCGFSRIKLYNRDNLSYNRTLHHINHSWNLESYRNYLILYDIEINGHPSLIEYEEDKFIEEFDFDEPDISNKNKEQEKEKRETKEDEKKGENLREGRIIFYNPDTQKIEHSLSIPKEVDIQNNYSVGELFVGDKILTVYCEDTEDEDIDKPRRDHYILFYDLEKMNYIKKIVAPYDPPLHINELRIK